MRAILLACCVLGIALPAEAEPREHTVAGRLAVLIALRDARLACADQTDDAWRRCVERESADVLVAAERTAETPLYAGPNEVREAQGLTLGAMQAAFADCRARGIQRGSVRWEFCNIERGIVRLGEALRQ
ncbi:hypothetical protein ACE7GA_25105 [Roseomonas sp. CCTCC AB2023176]|uniref:hypothetical protein n=1 Tax=Roseomonas sp. CCTCC AB2023176 TaxID=3342640 RepID=UPI0035E1135E